MCITFAQPGKERQDSREPASQEDRCAGRTAPRAHSLGAIDTRGHTVTAVLTALRQGRSSSLTSLRPGGVLLGA